MSEAPTMRGKKAAALTLAFETDARPGAHAESEKRFRDLIDALPAAVYTTDADGRITHYNKAAIDFSGRVPELGSDQWCVTWKLFHPDGRPMPHDECPMAVSLREGRAVRGVEAVAERPDGTRLWFEPYPTPFFDEQGRLAGGVNMLVDITERKQAEEALRRSEERYRALVEQTAVGIAETDLEGRFRTVNNRYCVIVGYSPEELAGGMRMQDITHPDDLPKNLAQFERLVKEGTPFTIEKRYIRKDGDIVFVRNSVAPLRDARGRIAGVAAATIDITEERRARKALRDHQERLQLATEGAGVGVWDHDLAARKFVWSERHCEMLGVSKDVEPTFEAWRERVHPDDLDDALAEFARAKETKTPFRAQYRIRRADTGEERWIEDAGRYFYGAGGAAIRCAGVMLDVTERQQQRAAARRLAAIVESSDDAIVAKDLNSVITSWNKSAERLFGWSAEEAIGRPVTILFPPDRVDEEEKILERIRRGDTVAHYETVRQRKDGRLLEVALTVSPIRNASGAIVGVSKIARDITERKNAERRHKLLLDELNHRVKNTLATVQSIALLTLNKDAPVEEQIAAFNARLVSLSAAHDILTRTQWEGADIRAVVDSVLKPYAAAKRRFSIDGPALHLRSKAVLAISLALHELATNASKYGALSGGKGRVSIAWMSEDGALHFNWRESDGPEVRKPRRRGFGSRLIEEGLSRDIGGEVELSFAPSGVRCTIKAPLEEMTGRA